MRKSKSGFTIVELLIVIVVIGILAVITIATYGGVQERARLATVDSDLQSLGKAIHVARINTGKTLAQITGSTHTGGACTVTGNIYPGSLDKSHSCWTLYLGSLNKIATAADTNLNGIKAGDPWGAPYYIDENEGEDYSGQGLCRADIIGVYTNPQPATRNGYDIANGGSTGYNWLRQYLKINSQC